MKVLDTRQSTAEKSGQISLLMMEMEKRKQKERRHIFIQFLMATQ